MQNFKNHSRYNPLHHFVLTPISLTIFVWTIINFFKDQNTTSQKVYFLLISIAILLVSMVGRIYATKNQDRIIRLEMRQRYFEMTGKSFAEKENQLRLGQIIALRFASDEELLNLMEKAIAEKLKSKEIKQAIRNWQADTNRV
jgi:hypothetical protein